MTAPDHPILRLSPGTAADEGHAGDLPSARRPPLSSLFSSSLRPPVQQRPPKLAPIHGNLLPPSSGPSPVVRGTSAVSPPQPPHSAPLLLDCPRAPPEPTWTPSAELRYRRVTAAMTSLVRCSMLPSPAPPPASPPSRLCSTVAARHQRRLLQTRSQPPAVLIGLFFG
ncbi:hypothetical protein ACQJBY_008987 [Aegilops geniculata]